MHMHITTLKNALLLLSIDWCVEGFCSHDQNMTSHLKGKAIVIMGVSGAGKSAIGEMLANVLKCNFLDADDFHSLSSKEKMRQGIPLSEEDRIPWLDSLRDALMESLIEGKTIILGCSSLQIQYREMLRSADPYYQSGSYVSAVKFVLLDVQAEVLAERLKKRDAEGKHFMPAILLQSQLDLLHIDENEGIYKVDATRSPGVIVNAIKEMFCMRELNDEL